MVGPCCGRARIGLLGGWVLDELDALGNVSFQAVIASLEELLLMFIGAADNVNGLLGAAGLNDN